ncbi:DNA-directed RNA polymerase, mitochondrial-like [Physella acuta]|uniref:DNA-directed RNA polymerase, mitochondrial-like n=1 Tax=Physella acuta TaxID=109671 RepID=UPI0027DBED36|nr:DNA-directed RNA polymerase, mitochondrial-like [Physella acuta]
MSVIKLYEYRKLLYFKRCFTHNAIIIDAKRHVTRNYLCGGTFSLRNLNKDIKKGSDLQLTKNEKKSYSTTVSVKPNMTAAMHNWKKKKRKSKTQQKKELEQLQQDLVNLLTKRAIQLVKNKSLHGAQRTVVSTHVFSNLLNLNTDESNLLQTVYSDVNDFSSSGFQNRSDFVAHQLETHILSKTNPGITENISLSESNSNYTREVSKLSNPFNKPDSVPIMKAAKYIGQISSVSNSKNIEGEKLHNSSIGDFKQFISSLKYSEIFPEHLNYKTPTGQVNDTFDFSSSFRKFVTDLEVVKNIQVVNTNHAWSLDTTEADTEELTYNTSACLLPAEPHQSTVSSTQPLKVEDSAVVLDINHPVVNSFGVEFDEHLPISPSVTLHEIESEDYFVDLPNSLAKPDQKKTIVEADKEKTHLKEKKSKKSPKSKVINVAGEFNKLNQKAYAEACSHAGCELLAVRNLQYSNTAHQIESVDILNRLIHALAKKKNLSAIKNLFALIKKQGLVPSLQNYAGCLECIGRMKNMDYTLCEKLLSDIKDHGYDIKELVNTCSFESDELTYILKAIKLVEPDFVLNPPKLDLDYNNDLLKALNATNEKAVEKNQYSIDVSKDEIFKKALVQLNIEKAGEITVKSIYTSSSRVNPKVNLEKIRAKVLDDWRMVLLDSFKQKLEGFEKKARDSTSMNLYPYLKLLPPEDYVDVLIKFLNKLFLSSEGYSSTQSFFRVQIGHAINRKYNINSKISAGLGEKMMKLYEHYLENLLDKDYTLKNHRVLWLQCMQKYYDTVNMDLSQKKWPAYVHREVGRILLDMVLYDLKIDANLFRPSSPKRFVPAFCTIYRPDVTLPSNSEIKLHPAVSKLFKMDNMESFSFEPSTVPMIVPPIPWISKNIGGLFFGSNSLIRLSSDINNIDVLNDVKETQFSAVLDSLNTLSSCAWIINKPILDLQIEIFNNKGNPQLKVSPSAADLPPLPNIKVDMSSREKAAVYRERIQLQQKKHDVHGLWCSDLYRLSIANKFRDEVFWFPHSLDFRGRTYPLPPHFNHLGSDNVRGMLLFAKGKPLGAKGFDWLKIHLINLTGLKKRCSNAERLEFAESLMHEILDSADRPLTGNKWWQAADEPWQALACCMEIAKIERFDGNKEDYICHFPVHQDGSCNGLQHYAALGKDQAGAESVNLQPFDAPQDVYSDVVELVEKTRKRDAEEGKEIAKALEGFIKRKVIKQTIMTTVYGVTYYGAKLQIHRQLKDIPNFPSEHAWGASLYLTETTFNCLREMFTATKDIQDWLTDSARQISAFAPIDWLTPLGFPVLQPYFKKQGKDDSLHHKVKPNTMKQKNAFPPNYIHSLDSTHMMLTSLYCMHAGITFVSVHDCYWTHACDVPIMNKICREQFVNMHKQPLLENLSQHLVDLVKRSHNNPQLQEDMKAVDIPALIQQLGNLPKRGTFDLNNVLDSTYFFS